MADTGSMQVMGILANARATIAEGEVLQLTAAQDIATTEDIYIQIVRGKTAALFSAATELGSVVAGADARCGRRCSNMAMRWGSPFRSSMICWITAARPRPLVRISATISASAS